MFVVLDEEEFLYFGSNCIWFYVLTSILSLYIYNLLHILYFYVPRKNYFSFIVGIFIDICTCLNDTNKLSLEKKSSLLFFKLKMKKKQILWFCQLLLCAKLMLVFIRRFRISPDVRIYSKHIPCVWHEVWWFWQFAQKPNVKHNSLKHKRFRLIE